MRLFSLVPGLIVLTILSATASAQKAALNDSIDSRAEAAWQDALQIWEWAEPGYQEARSAALLAGRLEASGFIVERGVAGIPTAFVATIGSGEPILGILGEFDALPGLSQQAVSFRRLREGGTYGHGCGHHLFGVASASAAIALGEQIRAGKLKGTVRYYGCPAEEGGSAKVFLVQAGLFKDCDAVLHWHPGSRNAAGDRSSLARIAAKFRFHGKAAHAATKVLAKESSAPLSLVSVSSEISPSSRMAARMSPWSARSALNIPASKRVTASTGIGSDSTGPRSHANGA